MEIEEIVLRYIVASGHARNCLHPRSDPAFKCYCGWEQAEKRLRRQTESVQDKPEQAYDLRRQVGFPKPRQP